MRKSILYRSRRKANRIAKKDKVTWYDAAALLSYMGWYDHTDTYDYFLLAFPCEVQMFPVLQEFARCPVRFTFQNQVAQPQEIPF